MRTSADELIQRLQKEEEEIIRRSNEELLIPLEDKDNDSREDMEDQDDYYDEGLSSSFL